MLQVIQKKMSAVVQPSIIHQTPEISIHMNTRHKFKKVVYILARVEVRSLIGLKYAGG